MPVRYWCPHAYSRYISTNTTAFILLIIELKNSYSMAPDMGKRAGGMGQVRNRLFLPRRSLASTPDPTSCLDVAYVPIYVLTLLSSLDSNSTLTTSFVLQDQHPLPITLCPHSSTPSPSLSHAMFPVWSPHIFPLWHPNPASLHCYFPGSLG